MILGNVRSICKIVVKNGFRVELVSLLLGDDCLSFQHTTETHHFIIPIIMKSISFLLLFFSAGQQLKSI